MTVEEKREAIRRYGKSTRCASCKLFPSWCANYNMRTCPESALDEALELIGYEQPDKEDNVSENKKPRLAEILNVEVGEKFKIKGYFDGEFPFDEIVVFQLLEDGTYTTTPAMFQGSAAALLQSIDHPERIIHMPRWTKQEVKDAKAIQRIMPKYTRIHRSNKNLSLENQFGMSYPLDINLFPSLATGQTVKLADIIGGNT